MLRRIAKYLILLFGLYAIGQALWNLSCTAMYVHEAERIPGIVTDVRMRPFSGYVEMLSHGNLPWDGDTSYQPHVRYTYSGVPIVDTTLPDLDNRNYANGEEVEIILHPQKPHLRHLNRAKFLWGGDVLLLLAGGLCVGFFRLIRKRRRRQKPGHTPAKQENKPSHKQPTQQAAPPAPAPTEAPAPKEEPAAPKKRRRKSGAAKASAATDKPEKKPRAPRKSAKAAAENSPDTPAPKRRRKSKKKAPTNEEA